MYFRGAPAGFVQMELRARFLQNSFLYDDLGASMSCKGLSLRRLYIL